MCDAGSGFLHLHLTRIIHAEIKSLTFDHCFDKCFLPRKMPPKRLAVGIYLEDVTNIETALTKSREAGFDYICCGVVNETYRQRELAGEDQDPNEPFSWFDLSLSSSDWGTSVVGVLSDVQEDTESLDGIQRDRACSLLHKELGYIQHLSLASTILNLHPGDFTNLARAMNSKVTSDGNHASMLLWVRVPMMIENQCSMNGDLTGGFESDDKEVESGWNMWNEFRSAGNAERRTFPILNIPIDLPDNSEIDRWLGEPVKAICLNEESFTTNSSGYPILPKRTQRMVKKFLDIGAQAIINCKPGHEPSHYLHFKQYMEYMYGLMQQEWDSDTVRKYTKGYEDYLQSPLQPLMDNLEANTYEVFERDPTKYELYQQAISKALVYKVPEEEKETKTLVVMVVGAGRGPLVRNSLAAAESVGRKIKLFAVEKNINAVCTLQHLKHHVWKDKVTVVSCDMRDWNPEEKADILISELLGSFGDNELSPECLDGAQKFLKDDGIMIPQNYTSYISPVMSTKLHADVRSFSDMNKHLWSHFETPYVVYMKNFYEIDKPRPLFNFSHPKIDMKESNDRFRSVEFTAKLDCLLHGIAGYFDSQLFGDVIMSIHPETHSEGMFSWFSILFPIREPVTLKKGDTVKINFWRCSNKHNVWYEWSLTSPTPVPIHNVNGRSYTIGL